MSSGILDRVWNRLEERYGAEAGCGCSSSTEDMEILEKSNLTREDLTALHQGEASMEEIIEKTDADIDPDSVDTIPGLIEEIKQAYTV